MKTKQLEKELNKAFNKMTNRDKKLKYCEACKIYYVLNHKCLNN